MPQATDELRARWGGEQGVGEDKAYHHLSKLGFTMPGGRIKLPNGGFDFKADTTDTWGAIEFLCDEWDYDFDPAEWWKVPADPLLWVDFNRVSVANDGADHSWIVMRWNGEWAGMSTAYGVNLVGFATREDAKKSCEERSRAEQSK